MSDGDQLRLYSRTAQAAATEIIRQYSTSFGMATSLLGKRHRQHIRNLYALVRVADEIVDGVANEAGLTPIEQRESLERYLDETYRALNSGYSTDVIVHAFARTAREAGIDRDLIDPFFASMRADLDGNDGVAVRSFDSAEHERYVYGSAEVIGLMCLRVFLRETPVHDLTRARLEHGARQLGAAFQNINFLRDLGDDTDRLGRSYLSVAERLTDSARLQWVELVRSQLADAHAVIPLLPRDCRAAIRSAAALFGALTDRVAKTPAADLYRDRIRVPDSQKARLIAGAVFRTRLERHA